jgi:acetolactate synthase-1/2/3 large subunit
MSEMSGARAILETLVDGGVEVCFTNPGTSEMHLVAGMETVPRMRGILCLFEGVATGAADGYARMAGRPASTLLHLGPGLGNGLANLHNARRAATPLVNLIGDHATYHKRFDAPLESDIDAIAGSVSRWVHRCPSPADAGRDTAAAIAATANPTRPEGGIATLILPADVCWSQGASPATVPAAPAVPVDDAAIEQAARALREGSPTVLLLGASVLRRDGLMAAGRIAAATGAKLIAENAPARHERGAGIPNVERLPYLGEMAAAVLKDASHLILVGARHPVSFFAYPDLPSDLVAQGCAVHELTPTVAALEQLADLVAGGATPTLAPAVRPELPSGVLTAERAAGVVGALLPEGAIVCDESITSGLWLAGATVGCPPHDWLSLCGGAIGQGMPLAVGAAVACPDRPVVNLEADGSALYTLQALWTQAQQNLDVTTIIFNNATYAILHMELRRTGAPTDNGRADALLDLPGLDFVAMSQGLGVPATRATTAEELAEQLRRALAEPGPHLIEAIITR